MGKVMYVQLPKGTTFQEVTGRGNDWVMLLLKTEDDRPAKKFIRLPEGSRYISVTQPYEDKIGVIYLCDSGEENDT